MGNVIADQVCASELGISRPIFPGIPYLGDVGLEFNHL
jgi:hypothetical protein